MPHTPPPDEDAPQTTDYKVLVLLTRIEGKLNLVAQRMDDLSPRVKVLEEGFAGLTLSVQSLNDGAIARDKTTLATAAALKDQKEAQEAQERAVQARSDQVTIPWARLLSAAALVVALGGVALAKISGG